MKIFSQGILFLIGMDGFVSQVSSFPLSFLFAELFGGLVTKKEDFYRSDDVAGFFLMKVIFPGLTCLALAAFVAICRGLCLVAECIIETPSKISQMLEGRRNNARIAIARARQSVPLATRAGNSDDTDSGSESDTDPEVGLARVSASICTGA